MRKLASIQRIDDIQPIEGKDRIAMARIKGWNVIIQKSEFNVGDKCVFLEIDSVLPEKSWFEFMRQRKFRVRTLKFGNAISQGLAFPLSVFEHYGKLIYDGDQIIGVDI